jgi:two-component system sensor histidine kinase AgrC
MMFAFSLGLEFGTTAIIGNSAYVVVMATVASLRNKNVLLSLVYAIFTNIIALLSTNLASSVLALVSFTFADNVELGRNEVMGSLAMSIAYLIMMVSIAFPVSNKLGSWFHAQINSFDAKLQKKLLMSILVGAFITLGIFFVMVFLRDILIAESILTLAYGISLAVVFLYLVFSIFAFTASLRKDIEMKHKNELQHNLKAYTKNVEDVATEMRKFRHDHRNLMLGFRAHIENKNWEGIREYYEGYMGEFAASSDVIEANIDKLGNIMIPELKSILFAKFMQASTAGITMFIEVDCHVTIANGSNLLDTCRIVGILMDNAIEACKDVMGSNIRFMATMTEDKAYFVFRNTCITPTPMNKIIQKGFTTKEGARGLGLYNASQLIAKNRNLTLKTSLKEDYFIQELSVR